MLAGMPCCPDSKRGKRRKAMLDAAHALFVEKGYEGTTLGDIVGRSGGSLATFYELFENKPGLLRALIGERRLKIDGPLEKALCAKLPYQKVLRNVAEEMLNRVLDPTYVGLFRVVIAQCITHPDLGRQVYDSGPAVSQAKAADYLATLANAGELTIDDPIQAARMFFQMVCGHLHTQLMFGLTVKLSAAERKRHLDSAVAGFIRMYEPVRT